MIKSSVLAQAGEALLAKAQQQAIPYVAGGMTLAGMDCQGLVEYLLMECGISRSECNLAGSNAHFRSSLSWRGTPEEAVARFGSVPIGAALFIWEESGEPSKYAGDGIGNANHMGLNLGNGSAIHASSSRGCVAQSVFKDKTVRNGGWNQVGLLRWVDYGIGDAASDDDSTADDGDTSAGTPTSAAEFAPYYAIVRTPDGNPVKMRALPSKACALYKKVPAGDAVCVVGERIRSGVRWCRVQRGSRKWYIMAAFLTRCGGEAQ